MIAKTNRSFWVCFRNLPRDIQLAAKKKFDLWKREPFHSSLHFKELTHGLWSVRINRNYRALARRKGDLVVWFWIGIHREYERLIEK